MTGYKITTRDRSKKFGVAANSLKMLREKAAKKLAVTKSISVCMMIRCDLALSSFV